MDPGSIALIGMAASAAGGATGALGSIMGGNAQAGQFKYQAGIAQMNAKIAEQNAAYQRSVGEVEAQQSGLKTRGEIGSTLATQGGRGLDVNSGSNVEVRKSEGEIGQQNERVIRSNASRRAYGAEVEAAQDIAQSRLYETSAKTSKTAGQIGAISSILGAASSVSSKWLQGNSAGVWA